MDINIDELITALRFQKKCLPKDHCKECEYFNDGNMPTPLPCRSVENLVVAAADALEAKEQEVIASFQREIQLKKERMEWRTKAVRAGAQLTAAEDMKGFPEIVCLCGSTRFFRTFDEANFKLTLEGKIVLSIGCNTKSDEGLMLTSDDKIRLDELHKRKIDLCNRVLVLNVGGYIGDSTRSEIDYAIAHCKSIIYWEPIEANAEMREDGE